ncbi:MAG TPA: cupin domain-containing protein [Thermoanaerobaculia bacterium]|nr:cupin domain-containing protein [Thermoanaerobaculia bacterium]
MSLKLLQLDDDPHLDERHDYPEGLFVTDGQIRLLVDGKAIAVKAGGLYIVPPGTLHSIAACSNGTAVIFE